MKPKLHFQRKYLPVLAVFAAKDDVRYYLNGFHIKPHPDKGVILTATDGHRIVTIHDIEGESNGEYIFPISKQLLAAAKKTGGLRFPNNRIEIVEHELRIHCLEDYIDDKRAAAKAVVVGYVEYINPIDGKFPNAGALFKKVKVFPSDKLCFNAKLLGDLSVIAANQQVPIIKMAIQGNEKALIAIGGFFNEIVAMVMSARDEDPFPAIPEFCQFAGHSKQPDNTEADKNKEAA
ncbi:hypothetical protein [Shewanella algae]|uniref:DNA polymerase III subunit beta family protein n=1 Tax=Shewanella algae TaxID=38313 RepID=UPI0031F58BFA